MMTAGAELRLHCQQPGHALGNEPKDGNRGIATAPSASTCRSSPTITSFNETLRLRAIGMADTP